MSTSLQQPPPPPSPARPLRFSGARFTAVPRLSESNHERIPACSLSPTPKPPASPGARGREPQLTPRLCLLVASEAGENTAGSSVAEGRAAVKALQRKLGYIPAAKGVSADGSAIEGSAAIAEAAKEGRIGAAWVGGSTAASLCRVALRSGCAGNVTAILVLREWESGAVQARGHAHTPTQHPRPYPQNHLQLHGSSRQHVRNLSNP